MNREERGRSPRRFEATRSARERRNPRLRWASLDSARVDLTGSQAGSERGSRKGPLSFQALPRSAANPIVSANTKDSRVIDAARPFRELPARPLEIETRPALAAWLPSRWAFVSPTRRPSRATVPVQSSGSCGGVVQQRAHARAAGGARARGCRRLRTFPHASPPGGTPFRIWTRGHPRTLIVRAPYTLSRPLPRRHMAQSNTALWQFCWCTS